MDTQDLTQPNESPENGTKNNLWIILLIIAIIALSALAYWSYHYY